MANSVWKLGWLHSRTYFSNFLYKKTFLSLGKLKMVLLFIKVVKSHRKHWLPWKCAPIYQIWAIYHKLWCRYGHDYGHLTWNKSMFQHGRPYREASFFKSCQNSCLPFFMATSTRKRTPCPSFTFFIFLYFLWYFSKLGQIFLHGNSLQEVESLKTLCGFRYIDYLGALKQFLVKFKSNLSRTCSSNLTYF